MINQTIKKHLTTMQDLGLDIKKVYNINYGRADYSFNDNSPIRHDTALFLEKYSYIKPRKTIKYAGGLRHTYLTLSSKGLLLLTTKENRK